MSKPHWAFIHPFQLRLQRGIEVYLWNLSLALAQSGIEVSILTWDGGLDIPEYARHPSIHIHRVPAVRYFQATFAIPFYVFYLLTRKYSHIFVHFAGYGEGVALRIARLVRPLDFSIVFHFPLSQVPHRYREFERWKFQRNASYLIAVSQATASEVEAWSGRSCEVIGHGVDTERFRPNAQLRNQFRQQLNLSTDATVLISVAALEKRKGIQWGIKALSQLLHVYPDLHYVIVGEGTYRQQLEALTTDLGVKENVQFLGAHLNVHPYLCIADIMLVLSQGEASSIALLEAMSCQLASITSACPPFDELICDTWGRIVDEKNCQQVAFEISDLINKPHVRREMGKAARENVIQHHQWRQAAVQYRILVQRD